MRSFVFHAVFIPSLILASVLTAACESGESTTGVVAGAGGTGGGGGTGAAPTSGTAGTGGTAGASATSAGGTAGTDATGGTGGSGATAGTAGSTGGAGTGGANGANGSSGTNGASGSAGTSQGGSSGDAGSAGMGGTGGTSGGASGTAGSSATGGTAGTAGAGGGWPTCDAPEPGAVTKTLHDIWQANPTTPTQVWSPGLFVTAISYGGCSATHACEIFVQQDEQYASLAAGSQQSMKLFVSGNTAEHFTTVAVGDKVDVDAFAWRYNVGGQNELLLQVNTQLRGCAKPVGTGTPVPVAATLADLSISSYENTLGPLLIKLTSVSGRPVDNGEIFALWDTATGPGGGDLTTVTNLSQYYLPGGHFSGLTLSKIHDFTSVTGVFSLYFESNTQTKYETIGPRTTSEYPVALVHP